MCIIAFLVLFFSFNLDIQESPDFVEEYHKLMTKRDELIFIKKYEDKENVNIKGYVVSLKMKQAKYKFFPWSKLSVFNREKKALNKLIKTNPNNVHLRYIRLVIQENAPKILGYNKHVKEDKLFLKSILKIKDQTDYLDVYILKNTSL